MQRLGSAMASSLLACNAHVDRQSKCKVIAGVLAWSMLLCLEAAAALSSLCSVKFAGCKGPDYTVRS